MGGEVINDIFTRRGEGGHGADDYGIIVHVADRDELGFYVTENPHYVTDIHATVLHQLGLDSHRLEIPGRKRLDIHRGRPIKEIIA